MAARALTAAAVALCLTGCMTSTRLVGPSQAKPVPASRMYVDGLTAEKGGEVNVMFVRDVGFVGSGVYVHLWIDGVKVASFDTGEKLTVPLKPGPHLFGAIPTDIFGMTDMTVAESTLLSGEDYAYRLGFDVGSSRLIIQRIMALPRN